MRRRSQTAQEKRPGPGPEAGVSYRRHVVPILKRHCVSCHTKNEPEGGLSLAEEYWVRIPDGYRAHQIRLEGGDCSTDSFCYPSV